MYRLTQRGVIRLSDNLPITRDRAEWEGYRQWLKTGGVPAPMPIVVVSPPTAAEITAQLTLVVQSHLDTTARQHGYDSVLSAATYAASRKPKFAAEGQACVAWRDDVWGKCYEIMADVLGGRRPVPTAQVLISELPAMVWPT